MNLTQSTAIAALLVQAASLTTEQAIALAERYAGQSFIRSSMVRGQGRVATTDHGRCVAKAHREAIKALPASLAPTLARAHELIVRRQVDLWNALSARDPRARDFRPAPFALFYDAVLAELVVGVPGVSRRSVELLRQDWKGVLG
jgi:hypothetical protein